MKKYLVILMLAALLLSCAAAETNLPELTKDLVILFTGDVHGEINHGWGYAGVTAMRDHLAQNNHMLLVDTGDVVGDAFDGAVSDLSAALQIMNAVGYNLAIPGDQELRNHAASFLQTAKEYADFPYVCANLNHDGKAALTSYQIFTFDGVKIAFIGVTTPAFVTDEASDEDAPFYDLAHDDTGKALYAAVQRAVDEARKEGAAYVVALTHLGSSLEYSPWTSMEIISHTSGIDILLDGNDPMMTPCMELMNAKGQFVLRACTGDGLANIGFAVIGADGSIETGMYEWLYDASFLQMMTSARPVVAAMEKILTPFNEALH